MKISLNKYTNEVRVEGEKETEELGVHPYKWDKGD